MEGWTMSHLPRRSSNLIEHRMGVSKYSRMTTILITNYSEEEYFEDKLAIAVTCNWGDPLTAFL